MVVGGRDILSDVRPCLGEVAEQLARPEDEAGVRRVVQGLGRAGDVVPHLFILV